MHRTPRLAVLATVALVLVAVAAACSSDDPSVSSGTSGPGTTATTRPVGGTMMTTIPSEQIVTGDMLIGHTFVSTSVTGRDLEPGTEITISFTDTDLSAMAGCNSMGGAYELAAGTLTVTGDLRTTMMMCEDPLGAQDSWLTNWLQSGLAVAPTAEGITLTGEGVTVELAQQLDGATTDTTDTTGATTETGPTATGSSVDQLVGPTWTVHSSTMGGEVMGWLGQPAATLTFAADGTVDIFTGCTTLTMKYAADNGLRLGPPVIPMECPDGSFHPGHSSLAIISGDPIQWSIVDGDLEMSAIDGGLIASPG